MEKVREGWIASSRSSYGMLNDDGEMEREDERGVDFAKRVDGKAGPSRRHYSPSSSRVVTLEIISLFFVTFGWSAFVT